MNFQPVIPVGGAAGWAFLERTRERQQEAFDNSADTRRDSDYFRANIAGARTAQDLVSDRRLLTIALGAFGLQDDIGNKAFIRDVLEGGTLEPDSLANRLSDKRYFDLSRAFGYGDFAVPNTQLSDFADRLLGDYRTVQFEQAVGRTNENISLALGMDRLLDGILAKDLSADGAWFSVMGSAPLRRIIETALGLPQSLGALDLDLQVKTFREKSERFLGLSEIADLADPQKRDKLRDLFLVRGAAMSQAGMTVRGSAALSILQGAVPSLRMLP